jgi:outer membrane biosynthesis protein TonB
MWKKRKKVILASLGSLLIHLAVALVVAWLFGLTPTATSEKPDEPLQVQIEHVPEKPPPPPLAAPTPPHRRFVDAGDLATAGSPPPDTAVESDRNTAASSELPPSGDQDAPSQKGKAVPLFAFDSQTYAPDQNSASAAAPASTPIPETEPPRPQPDRSAPRPQSTPPPEPPATPAPTPKPDEFAMDDPTPTPAVDFDPSVRAPDNTPPPLHAPTPPPPRRPAGGGMDQQKTQMNGKVANSGATSLAMVATPQGAYKKAVTDAIKTRWYAYINARLDTASYGTVTVHFFIERSGRVVSPHVIANSGNEALASASMQAIMEAHIPPIPDEVALGIKGGVMPLDFDFTLY